MRFNYENYQLQKIAVVKVSFSEIVSTFDLPSLARLSALLYANIRGSFKSIFLVDHENACIVEIFACFSNLNLLNIKRLILLVMFKNKRSKFFYSLFVVESAS